MQEAIIYGFIGGFSLLLGALVGVYFKFSQQAIARFMAFGSGVLICALTFGLMEQAFAHGGFFAVALGFLLGGSVFIGGDYLVHLKGGRRHRRRPIIPPRDDASNGRAITMGAVLDGIPESVALGVSIAGGGSLGILMVSAIMLSNFPEGISSVEGLKKEGFSKIKIFSMWTIVAITMVFITVLAYMYLPNIDPNNLGIIEAFAAGSLLAMLADTMMPEAYEEGGFSIGFVTVLGFLAAFILSRLK